jgi:hypothetical protein
MGVIMVTKNKTSDVHRYSIWFEQYSGLSDHAKKMFFSEDISVEIFRPASFYIISQISSNPQIYFLFIALFFGFFYVGILKILFADIAYGINIFKIFTILNFIFIFKFFDFQFVRSTTAIALFLYFFLMFCKHDKIAYLLLTTSSILIHFMMLFPVAFLIVYQFLPYKFNLKILYILFFVFSIFQFFEFSFLKDYIEEYLPTVIESKSSYLNEDYKEQLEEDINSTNWYIKYYRNILLISALYLLYSIIYKHRDINPFFIKILKFTFLFGILANVLSIIPLGDRYLGIVYPLIWFTISAYFLSKKFSFLNRASLKWVQYPMAFFIIIGLRNMFDIFPIEFFIGNPIISFLWVSDVPLIDIFK